ncbi:NUDIX domain-containing protein, partial [Candidatus Bipolaricaulota bacterium]|nr:NUDIX domain-containing protein [Candidatus Bipolaricaulota bacterium]
FPEDAPQVPAGTRPETEDPEDAVLREAWEETGLEGLTIAAFLGETDFEWPTANKIFRRRFYHLVCPGSPDERWRHYEEHPSEGPPDPILFELYWVDLPDGVPELEPGHDAFLQQLVARMNPLWK